MCPFRRRRFRPVTDGRLDVVINNFPFVTRLLHEESGIISYFQSSLYLYIQITNYKFTPIDNARMISYDMIRRVTLTQTCTTAALVPRAVCSCIALSCAVKEYAYRPVPS